LAGCTNKPELQPHLIDAPCPSHLSTEKSHIDIITEPGW